MRFPFATSVLLSAVVAAPAFAFTPYSEWRHDFASIDAAVASLPSSDINGSFNRISAILDRGSVRDLTAGAGNRGELPSNFENGMLSAIQDLRVDIKAGFPSLTLQQKLTLIQVVDVVVLGRNVELYQGYDQPPCVPTTEHPCPDIRPVVIKELDSLAGSLRSELVAMIQDYNTETHGSEPLPGTLTSANFDAALDRVRVTYLTIKGVESIDD